MAECTAAPSPSGRAKASTNLCCSDMDNRGSPAAEADDLDELIDQIASEDPSTRLFGVQCLRRRITDDCQSSYANLIRDKKAFDVILASLDCDTAPDLQFECTWVLNNFLSNRSHERPDLLIHCKAMCQPLVKLLSGAPDRIREQACWALANIVGECSETRDQALASGLLAALIGLWESQPGTGVLDATTLLMVNLFRDQEPRIDFEAVRKLLPHMLKLLDHPHRTVVPHVIWALAYMIEENETRIRLILKEDILNHLRHYLTTKDVDLLIPTLRVFGNISAKMSMLPSSVLADGLLDKMCHLLDHPEQKVRRQVLFFVCNISDGPDSNLQKIVDSGFMPKLGSTLLKADEMEKVEAFWIVPNLSMAKGGKFKKVVIEHCLEGFIGMLSLEDYDLTNCVLLTLRELLLGSIKHTEWGIDFETLRRKIEDFGGLKQIESVQQIGDEELTMMSHQIMRDFFWNEGETSSSMDDVIERPRDEAGPTEQPGTTQAERQAAEEQLAADEELGGWLY